MSCFAFLILLLASVVLVQGDQLKINNPGTLSSHVKLNGGIGQIVGVSKTNMKETFGELVSRFSDNRRQHLGTPSRAFRANEIAEICGTSSSVICGKAVVSSLGNSNTDTFQRCEARKNFLDCIDAQRKKCNEFAQSGYFPVLPTKDKISAIQEHAWKTLWTSGACILTA